jgi:hypothetical protein
MTASAGLDPTRRGPRFAWIQPDVGPAIYFDLIVSETSTNTSEVTDHPVEIGSDVSENIRHAPEHVVLEAVVTNTPTSGQNAPSGSYPGAGWQLVPMPMTIPKYTPPFSLSSIVAAGVSALGALLFGTPPTIATVLAPPGPQDRIAQVHNALTAIERVGALVTIIGTTKTYDSMAITSITVPRDELGSVTFKIECRRINIVATATVAAPTPLIKAAVPKKDAGPQTPAPLTAAQKQSIASQGLSSVVGLLGGGG